MHSGQLRGLRQGDVMVAVSFAPYAEETMGVVRQAANAGVPVIAITDSRVGALAQMADVALVPLREQVAGAARQPLLVALAQCLFIALAYRLELEYKPSGAAAR